MLASQIERDGHRQTENPQRTTRTMLASQTQRDGHRQTDRLAMAERKSLTYHAHDVGFPDRERRTDTDRGTDRDRQK